MKKSIARQMAKAARVPATVALSIVLALGCMPAVALADDGSKTVNDNTETFTEINSTGETGLNVVATGSDAGATVTGDVTDSSNSEACGVSVSASGNNLTGKADVSGNVTASGKGDTYGIKASPDNGTNADITVDGSIDATSRDGEVSGIWVNADENAGGGNVTHIIVNESVTATGRGAVAGIKRTGPNQDYAYVSVAGNVTAVKSSDGGTAVRAGVNINAHQIDLVVGGTISGESGIVAKSSFVQKYQNEIASIIGKSSSKIAVWQIKANDNSKPVAYVPGDDNTIDEGKTKILLGMIDYIIKYGDGQKGFFSALSADRELGGASIGSSEYQTAKSGTALTFSLPDRAGYTLKQVFGLNGGPALTRNADGSYTLIVPDGGGILLRAEWEKVQKDNPDPTEPPEVKPAEGKQPETKATPAEGKQTETKATSTSASGQSNGTLAATSDQVPMSAFVLVSVIALACMLAAACARKATGR